MKYFNIILVVLVSITSCNENDVLRNDEGIIIEKPVLWSASLSDNSLIEGGIRSAIFGGDHMLFGGQRNNQQVLYMLNVYDGDVLWEWDDHLSNDEVLDIRSFYKYKNNLIFSQSSHVYCINTENGKTLWRKEEQVDFGTLVNGLGDFFYLSVEVENKNKNLEAVITVNDLMTGKQLYTIDPPYTKEYVNSLNKTGYLPSFTPFEYDNDSLILITYGNALPEFKVNNYLGLYNLTKKNWVYKDKLITGNTQFTAGDLTIHKDKVYLQSSKKLFCYGVFDGSKIWERSFAEGLSDIIVVDRKVIANCEDTYLYAMDPDTGELLWKEKSSGTSSPLVHLNSVVYFTGGGDGLLHAVDVETGKHLWKIRSPDEKVNSGAWFKRHIAVVPSTNEDEKGRVLTSSYLSAFCYEAAR